MNDDWEKEIRDARSEAIKESDRRLGHFISRNISGFKQTPQRTARGQRFLIGILAFAAFAVGNLRDLYKSKENLTMAKTVAKKKSAPAQKTLPAKRERTYKGGAPIKPPVQRPKPKK